MSRTCPTQLTTLWNPQAIWESSSQNCQLWEPEKTFKETITLDYGASCSLLRLNITQKLNLNLRPAPGVTITGAGGDSLEVAGQTDVFFSFFDNKPVRLHLFVSPDLHEDVLISADHLEALALLPPKWPHCLNPKHKDYSANYMANSLKQEKAEEQRDQTTESSEEEEDPDTIPVCIPRTRVNLDEELWQDTGEVHDIPKLDTFPEETRQILLKYGDVFKSSLSKARKIKTEPIKLEIDPNIPKPRPATKCRSVPLHWQESLDDTPWLPDRRGCHSATRRGHRLCGPKFSCGKATRPLERLPRPGLLGRSQPLSQEVSPPNSQPIPSMAEGPPSLYLLFLRLIWWLHISSSLISEESQPLTTFLTPRGKFMMTRLSMGLSASSDQFNQQVGGVLDNFPNLSVMREIDDLLESCRRDRPIEQGTGTPPQDLPATQPYPEPQEVRPGHRRLLPHLCRT